MAVVRCSQHEIGKSAASKFVPMRFFFAKFSSSSYSLVLELKSSWSIFQTTLCIICLRICLPGTVELEGTIRIVHPQHRNLFAQRETKPTTLRLSISCTTNWATPGELCHCYYYWVKPASSFSVGMFETAADFDRYRKGSLELGMIQHWSWDYINMTASFKALG